MDRTISMSSRVEGAAQAAHQATDKIADAASSAAEWVSTVPAQAKDAQVRLTDAASASIRARPIAVVAGAFVIGYLLGRIGRD